MTELMDRLAFETGMRFYELHKVMNTAPSRYKRFNIPKRSGGLREIAQPAREVKDVQRALVTVLLSELPVHPCATAYREGVSILTNAAAHAGSGPILKLDLRNFFPSIKSSDWIAYCRKTACLKDEEDIFLTSRLLFYKCPGERLLRLAIGAPSSPVLSNALMYEIDCKILGAVEPEHVRYTRYADDLTFSAPRAGHLSGIMSAVASILRAVRSPRLDINGEKTTYVTRKFRRSVTGLVLTNSGAVSLGRDKKRAISATVHHAKLGRLDRDATRVLAGTLAYVNVVEPQFLFFLKNKYGSEVIEKIQKQVFFGNKLKPHRPPVARV